MLALQLAACCRSGHTVADPSAYCFCRFFCLLQDGRDPKSELVSPFTVWHSMAIWNGPLQTQMGNPNGKVVNSHLVANRALPFWIQSLTPQDMDPIRHEKILFLQRCIVLTACDYH